MNTHDLAQQLLAGPDVPAVVPTYDDDDREQHVEVTTSEPLPVSDTWYDTKSTSRQDPAVVMSTVKDQPS